MPLLRAIHAATIRRLCIAVITLALIPVAGFGALLAGATQEYDLKAVFLFNFAQFVDWPPATLAEAGTPITIGIVGDDPFGGSLDQIVANETIRNRRLLVRRFRGGEPIDSCQILFISRSEANRIDHIVAALDRRSVLTVGDTPDFTARSGMIGFEVVQRRLKLRINLAAARKAGLKISSKLLRQATIVGSERRVR